MCVMVVLWPRSVNNLKQKRHDGNGNATPYTSGHVPRCIYLLGTFSINKWICEKRSPGERAPYTIKRFNADQRRYRRTPPQCRWRGRTQKRRKIAAFTTMNIIKV